MCGGESYVFTSFPEGESRPDLGQAEGTTVMSAII